MPSHKVANPTHIAKCFPRMSWAPANLYNLYQRTYGPPTAETKFTKSALTMFQQRWKAKQLVRAYHGDWIQEGKFKKEYVPDRLPPIVRKDGKGEKVPLASMMFVEVEKRVDTVVFRCCFADSVYRARMMVVHGKVRLNGVKISDPNIKLQPGDLISVDPSAVTTLSPPKPNEASYKTSSKKTSPPPPPPAEADASLPGTSTPPTSMPTVALTANQKVLPFHLPDYAAPFLFIPSYLEMSFATCSAVYLRHPTPAPGVSEVPSPYEADGEVMRLAWEYYVRLGRRGDERPPSMVGKRLVGGRFKRTPFVPRSSLPPPYTSSPVLTHPDTSLTMTAPKIAVIYSSTYGHIRTLAETIAAAAKAGGAEVDIYQFPEILSDEVLAKMHAAPKADTPIITADLMPQYDGFLFGIPTRYGRAVASASAFFDATGGLWAKGALTGKFAGIFTSSASQHGGQETTALTTIPFFAHHGIAYVPIGFAHPALTDNTEIVGGSAYGAASIAGGDGSRGLTEKELAIATYQGEQFAKFVGTFVAGKAVQAAAAAASTSDAPIAAKAVPAAVATEEAKPYQVEEKTVNPTPAAEGGVAPGVATPVVPAAPKKSGGLFSMCCGGNKDNYES